MILFVGCSYTWGSGLQYEYLYDKGWSVDEINKVLPVNYHLEHLSYEADQYRKQNNWPNLVAKEMNKAFVIGTYTNGGSNLTTTLHSIEHCHQISRTNSITTVVVQFSDWLRDVNDDTISRYPGKNLLNVTTQEFIDNTILNQIEQVVNVCNSLRGAYDHNLKDHKYPKNPYPAWVGLSWQKDVGDVLKKHYPENFIPIYRDGKEYNSFAPNIDEGLRICDVLPGVDDTHLSSKGCKVIADSIIRKLKSYE
jgi:lysophospholipase L1-like esterase|tara:strand:- start:834 stop:1586 length:753 start_codon:yes stop_codon:yes gene_type:complete